MEGPVFVPMRSGETEEQWWSYRDKYGYRKPSRTTQESYGYLLSKSVPSRVKKLRVISEITLRHKEEGYATFKLCEGNLVSIDINGQKFLRKFKFKFYAKDFFETAFILYRKKEYSEIV